MLVSEIEKIQIERIYIWKEDWVYTGEIVKVNDLYCGKEYLGRVVKITKSDTTIFFLPIEFSNNVWGIYLKDNYKISK